MTQEDAGPGILTTDHVGLLTIAKTTLITTRYAMAYAAAVNDANPAYFDDLAPGGVNVHPGIAFALQWPSRFRPDQEPNPRAAPYGVHASTDLTIHRPFRAGDAVTTQGKTIQMRQTRPGVYNVDRYRMTGSNGELIAELYYNGITRGATLAGDAAILDEEPAWPEISAPAETAIWRAKVPVALHAAQQYTECAQIYNPIHTEPSIAKAAGLPGIILHGSATKAMSLGVVISRCFGGRRHAHHQALRPTASHGTDGYDHRRRSARRGSGRWREARALPDCHGRRPTGDPQRDCLREGLTAR